MLIADEAHRSQYDFIDGFARHIRDALPNASFIGFTGTPIELADRNTRAVFGDYISIYDVQQAVQDGATVPIHYESRLAAIALDENEKPHIDPEFEEVTEAEEVTQKEKLKTKWAQLEALTGTKKRLGLIADDIIAHFEERLEVMDGKAMIVCMSRRICVDLYNAIVKRRPEWHDTDDTEGFIKVVMTGSASDDTSWQPHIRNKARREELAVRFKNPDDLLKLVIVRDMWLTGFDAPPLDWKSLMSRFSPTNSLPKYGTYPIKTWRLRFWRSCLVMRLGPACRKTSYKDVRLQRCWNAQFEPTGTEQLKQRR